MPHPGLGRLEGRAARAVKRVLQEARGRALDALVAKRLGGGTPSEYDRAVALATKRELDAAIASLGQEAAGEIRLGVREAAKLAAGAAGPIRIRVDPGVVAYAESTAGDLVREWAEGVGRRVRLATTRAVAGGLTEREYLKAIRDAMGDEGTVARVERIARTEVNRAYQQQRAANDEQLHDAGVDLVKRWVATLDDRVRDTHLAIHGQERELLDLFNVGGHATFDTPPKSSAGHKANGPMDPTLPAEESINCRCDVIYVDRAAAERRYIRKSDR